MFEVNAIFASNPSFCFLQCAFANSARLYTYKALGEFAEGDKVLVDSPSQGLVVVSVVKVLKPTQVDLQPTQFEYKWVVQKVDFTHFNSLVELEAEMRAKITKTKIEKEQQKLIEQLHDTLPEEQVQELTKLVRL